MRDDPDSSRPAWSEPGEEPEDGAPDFRDDGERYAQRGLLGVGGMGRVYAARDRRLRREVALKVASTPELTARLAREALITAQLEHPGIVAVYDAGHDAEGLPWYTMRLIRGRTLEERLAECGGLEDRLALLGHFHGACQAVAYAHSMGIVHRDLKPSNIMVGEFGETQVADWGLARPVDEALPAWERIVTASAATGVAGTSRYMSPEQARGELPGRAADVWCLGVVLYELLSGRRPPAEPGVAPTLDGLDGAVPPDLLAVVRHSLAADPADRYGAAGALSEDLGRYLAGRRVQVHHYSPLELLQRLVQAWRAPLVVGALALLVLAIFGAVAAQRTAEARRTAERNLARALAQQAVVALDREHTAEAAVLAAHSLELEASPVARGVLAATSGPRPERVAQVALPKACGEDVWLAPDRGHVLCSSEGRVVFWSLAEGRAAWRVEEHLARAPAWVDGAVAFTTVELELVWLDLADGRVLDRQGVIAQPSLHGAGDAVFGVSGRTLTVYRLGAAPADPLGICQAMRAALDSDGETLLVGCDDGSFRVYDGTGERHRVEAVSSTVDWADVSWSGDAVFAGTRGGEARRLDLATGSWGASITGIEGGVLELAPVVGTDHVVVRGERGDTRIWDTALNAWVGNLPSRVHRVFEGGAGGVLVLGDGVETWRLPPALRPSVVDVGAGVTQVTVSPDGRLTAYAQGTGVVGLLETRGRKELARWQWQEAVAKCVAFVGEQRLFSAGMGAPGGRILTPGQPASLLNSTGEGSYRRAVALSDGTLVPLSYGASSARIDPAADRILETLDVAEFFDGSASPDRTHLALLGTAGGSGSMAPRDCARCATSPTPGPSTSATTGSWSGVAGGRSAAMTAVSTWAAG